MSKGFLGAVGASFGLVATSAVAFMAAPADAATLVDLELSLLVDVSNSVDATEFALQRDGYVAAFRNPLLLDAIQSGPLGRIAVNFVYWSSNNQQQETVGFTLLEDAASANAFADAIAAAPRPFSNRTSVPGALNFAVPLFAANDFDASRQVIDVSGDGTSGARGTTNARDNALLAGIDTINGLPIGGDPVVEAFYQNSVIGGSGAFSLPSASFAEFETAVTQKLQREIVTEVPEPATTLGFLALGVLGGRTWLKKRKQQPSDDAFNA